ncbi:NAD-reducing hydrogenase subunit HoxF [Thermogutta terrifontis]|uniref:NAD-reducing hydrogenase subunit HoxF n=1 Tax=Thermogutta terrifontis TaxID=1331910 RepID=A0A286RKE8_9BACT|nr:NADH-quinone oxidoreductase subunit NuoF [Thermogutta terrifontis]ASV76443.1 NAD-reducing hydrogenase subunit HoxF [Thermogutta terrifontis]
MTQAVWDAYNSLKSRAESVYQERVGKGRIFIQVGSATCEHAAGSLEVAEEFRKHIAASGRDDIVLRKTGCTGRCSREPIVSVFRMGEMPIKYQLVNRELVHKIFTQHVLGGEPLLDHILDGPIERLSKYEILNCGSLRCGWKGEQICGGPMANQLRAMGISPEVCRVTNASCFGACSAELAGKCTHILVRPQNVLYRISTLEDLQEVVREHIQNGRIVERLRVKEEPVSQDFFELYGEIAFFNRQTRIALRHNGIIDPTSIEEYFHYRGFEALARVLAENDPEKVVEEVTRSKLRGRGGGGFPTGQKWALARKSREKTRYIICNADEGDPGAFMDRSMLESDPFNVIEGMIIGAFAIGSHRGFVYVRAEYPLAVERVENAIQRCREWGLLGKNILNSGFDFDIEIRLGAGAFVCGEETALIHSIEGERGQPRVRPPYPTEVGLWGKPTVINNVETFANVPAIIIYGADWFARIGSDASGGTKVFALAGKVKQTGLVEVPIGITLREVVMEIGGGSPSGKAVKAVQTGGPAGGCIPASMLNLRVDFDTLNKAGSIMGSGGMIVLDEDDCMVDIAKFFMAFSQDESCGKCTPCREGTTRMMEILERITTGKADESDLVKLERLAHLVRKASLCGLGRAAPNPVLSTLTHFRDEYLAHVRDKRCPAKKCVALIRYEIDPEKCVGCTACARNCPVECISGERRKPHVIDQTRCIKCGRCFQVCRFDAVLRL